MRPPAAKYYDRANRRLVYVRRQADPSFWDEHWSERDKAKTLKTHGGNKFYVATTARYLPAAARVLEGGCGLADKVYALQCAGFTACGLDFARETVQRAKAAAPDLRLSVGDIRSLPYREGCFDGYWSIGAIEHFYEGFAPIASEMRRVLKSGGYLFLTFPAMSPLRRLKARLGAYPDWGKADTPESRAAFYQFALTPENALAAFVGEHGFSEVARVARGGINGLKEEVPWLAPILDPISKARRRPLTSLRKLLERILPRLTGHTVLLVMRAG
ncbi:MAG TPA: class I SAM-dependent methyltransferase [Candidatus Polarisedimenticolia bacterium]|nr:class I SAM-dependent methyltransferase [Candidatus Polarisedimenticolia bacterium]